MTQAALTRQESPDYRWRSSDLGTAAEVELPEGRLHFHERGQGPVLLFAHGWLANANLWRKVVAPLSRRFRCIVPDLPLGAHLQAMHDSFDGSTDAVARLLNGLLDELGIDDVTLVGNDSGGAYSQIAAAGSPQRVRGLILNACETPYDSFPPAAFSGLVEAARSPAALAALLAPLRNRAFRANPAAFGGLIKHPIVDRVSDTYALPALELAGVCRDACKVITGASQTSVAAAGRKLVSDFMGRVTFVCPTEDRFFSLENVRRYAAELTDAHVELIADSFAFTPEDQPDKLSECIAAAVDATAARNANPYAAIPQRQQLVGTAKEKGTMSGIITFVPHTVRAWRGVAPGVEFSALRSHGGTQGQTLLVRMAKGAHAQLHHHPGGEETLILSGRIRIGEHTLVPGDYLWTPPGVAHEGYAEEETVFFVVLPEGLRLEAGRAAR